MNEKERQLQLVTFEQAIRLKNAGFDLPVDAMYYGDLTFTVTRVNYNEAQGERYSVPTVALAIKWFRDVKGAKTSIIQSDDEIASLGYINDSDIAKYGFKTHEAAESALLDELLTVIEQIDEND